ncbi:MAG: surface-adhesin E family protein [Burkholderiales bacterium]
MRHLLLLPCLLAPACHAADWVEIPGEPGSDRYFYDSSKLFIETEQITYWKRAVFNVAQPVKDLQIASGLYRERIDCSRHTLQLISYLLYAPDGELVEYLPSHETQGSPIIPDTVGDLFEKTLCELARDDMAEARRKSEIETRQAEAEARQAEAMAIRLELEAQRAKTGVPAAGTVLQQPADPVPAQPAQPVSEDNTPGNAPVEPVPGVNPDAAPDKKAPQATEDAPAGLLRRIIKFLLW